MWIFNAGIWSHYKGTMEKIQIKRFMNKEVLPFACLHCSDSVSLKSVMKMNSNSALDDFKATDSVLYQDFIDTKMVVGSITKTKCQIDPPSFSCN